MSDNTIHLLQGQIEALNHVLVQIVSTLDPNKAAAAAAGLAIERELIWTDRLPDTPNETIEIQERLLDNYLQLLTAAAARG
ncbi:hypothetical protein [Corticibacter populi]|uniref:hypothetical protein n=1 Tax=Corticibacter populi TaxID=1550736 RepID=UPI00102C3D51|nr:hypothetical protein [Corticibacter populi]RZS31686.1 hypothetical protein EV687_2355 [Corticibacter populi]